MMNPMQMMQQFNKFKQDMMTKNPGMDPQKMVSEMINSGKISPQQFEQARNLASSLGIKI